jgi:hypothetical protein
VVRHGASLKSCLKGSRNVSGVARNFDCKVICLKWSYDEVKTMQVRHHLVQRARVNAKALREGTAGQVRVIQRVSDGLLCTKERL